MCAGERCSFLLNSELLLPRHAEQSWRQVLEVNQDHVAVAHLAERLLNDRPALETELDADLLATAQNLESIIGRVDGFQVTGAEQTTAPPLRQRIVQHHAGRTLRRRLPAAAG
jgi:hypothetical protein